MRRYIWTAAIAAVVSSPVCARDHSGYFGVEAGVLFPVNTHVDGKLSDSAGDSVQASDIFDINYKTGYDVDLVGGYDLGMFRLEGEVGYKHAGLNNLHLPSATISALSDAGVDLTSSEIPVDGHTRVLSGMVNGLVDFGGNRGIGAYAGAGIGLADVKFSGGGLSASDTKFAWQLLAGVYMPLSENIDLGLKYRYFRTGSSNSQTASRRMETYIPANCPGTSHRTAS